MWPRLRDQGCSSVQRAHIGPTVGDVVIAGDQRQGAGELLPAGVAERCRLGLGLSAIHEPKRQALLGGGIHDRVENYRLLYWSDIEYAFNRQ